MLTTLRLAAVSAHLAGDPGGLGELAQVLDVARDAKCAIEIARCLQALETCSTSVEEAWAEERADLCRQLQVTWMPPVTFATSAGRSRIVERHP